MLTVYLLIKVIICFGLLFTVRYLTEQLRWVEILACYLMTASILQVTANVVVLNMKMFDVVKAPIILPIVQLDQIVIIPILTIWVIYFYKTNGRNIIKFFLTILWATVSVGLTYLNVYAGVYTPTGWNALVGYVEIFLVYLIVMSFYFIFLTFLKEELS